MRTDPDASGTMDLSAVLLSVVTMNTERVVVYGVVGLIFATTLASGPLVGAIDLTTTESTSIGEGNATVGAVSLPTSGEIASGRYGSGQYYLRVPDATVDVVNVTGTPLLAYKVEIGEMGYSRTTTHFLSASNTGSYTLSIEQDSIDADKVENETYDGQLSVFLRSSESERQLATRNITVGVSR